MQKIKVTDKRKSVTFTSLAERTQAENDVLFVEMVAVLMDVQILSEQIVAAFDV